jgi:hypothetical protein
MRVAHVQLTLIGVRLAVLAQPPNLISRRRRDRRRTLAAQPFLYAL